jgi:hypothetical protein
MTSEILSKLWVANAKIVGPAPERQIPSSPGWDLGVTDARISGSPGISSQIYQRRRLPNAFGMADGHDPALRDKSILDQAAISLMLWLTLLASAD